MPRAVASTRRSDAVRRARRKPLIRFCVVTVRFPLVIGHDTGSAQIVRLEVVR